MKSELKATIEFDIDELEMFSRILALHSSFLQASIPELFMHKHVGKIENFIAKKIKPILLATYEKDLP